MTPSYDDFLQARGMTRGRVDAIPILSRHFEKRYRETIQQTEPVRVEVAAPRERLPLLCEGEGCRNLRMPGFPFCETCESRDRCIVPNCGAPVKRAGSRCPRCQDEARLRLILAERDGTFEDLEAEASCVAMERAEELQAMYAASAARREAVNAGGPPVGKPLPKPSSCFGLVEVFIGIAVAAMGVTIAALILIGRKG